LYIKHATELSDYGIGTFLPNMNSSPAGKDQLAAMAEKIGVKLPKRKSSRTVDQLIARSTKSSCRR